MSERGGPPEPLALRDSSEVDAWERCYLAVIARAAICSSDAREAADDFIRARIKRTKPLEDHEREIAWYGERVGKLRAELERLVGLLRGAAWDTAADAVQAVLDADDNDHSAF